jgi:hypothetical protein
MRFVDYRQIPGALPKVWLPKWTRLLTAWLESSRSVIQPRIAAAKSEVPNRKEECRSLSKGFHRSGKFSETLHRTPSLQYIGPCLHISFRRE